jgi:hypothetical protein
MDSNPPQWDESIAEEMQRDCDTPMELPSSGRAKRDGLLVALAASGVPFLYLVFILANPTD